MQSWRPAETPVISCGPTGPDPPHFVGVGGGCEDKLPAPLSNVDQSIRSNTAARFLAKFGDKATACVVVRVWPAVVDDVELRGRLTRGRCNLANVPSRTACTSTVDRLRRPDCSTLQLRQSGVINIITTLRYGRQLCVDCSYVTSIRCRRDCSLRTRWTEEWWGAPPWRWPN